MTNMTTVKCKKFPKAAIIAVFVLVAAAIFSVSAAPVLAAPASPDISWYNTTSKDFTISTAAQLAGLAQLVNAKSDDFGNKKINIGVNIDLSAFTSWTPIGNSSAPFKGAFDGKSHTIRNLSINASTGPAGLFGKIGAGASVENLNLKGIDIKDITGDAGGIAGVNEGIIKKCSVTGVIKGTGSAGGIAGNN